jgi:hypothetical protein
MHRVTCHSTSNVAEFSAEGKESMKGLQTKVFKTRLLLIVAMLALVGLALGFHQLIR